jgi:hypothetical protein
MIDGKKSRTVVTPPRISRRRLRLTTQLAQTLLLFEHALISVDSDLEVPKQPRNPRPPRVALARLSVVALVVAAALSMTADAPRLHLSATPNEKLRNRLPLITFCAEIF